MVSNEEYPKIESYCSILVEKYFLMYQLDY